MQSWLGRILLAIPAQKSIAERIDDQSDEMFGARAIIDTAYESIQPEDNYRLWRCLGDVSKRLNDIASELDLIGTDSKRRA